MALYEKLAGLPLEIESIEVTGLSQLADGGWERHTSVVKLRGSGLAGVGEDVTYQTAEHGPFQGRAFPALAGRFDLDGFLARLDREDLLLAAPESDKAFVHRRWAFESAALDLALQQADLGLAAALGREQRPVRFALSPSLGDPPAVRVVDEILNWYPDAELKLDAGHGWTPAVIEHLASTGAVRVVDLKGQYHGGYEGTAPATALYERVRDGFPEAFLEDPGWTDETRSVLAGALDRVTYDAPLCSLADLVRIPEEPRCVNVKPSRFGFLAELLRVYEYCERRGIGMYGGGQFELGPGRGQIQALAAIFHPDGPNDVAPSGYNLRQRGPGLPRSPLVISDEPGFGSRGAA